MQHQGVHKVWQWWLPKGSVCSAALSGHMSTIELQGKPRSSMLQQMEM